MKPRNDLSLWVGVGAAFALLLASWIILVGLAADHPVQSVPLAPAAVSAQPDRP